MASKSCREPKLVARELVRSRDEVCTCWIKVATQVQFPTSDARIVGFAQREVRNCTETILRGRDIVEGIIVLRARLNSHATRKVARLPMYVPKSCRSRSEILKDSCGMGTVMQEWGAGTWLCAANRTGSAL
jgi:hypothetical protein